MLSWRKYGLTWAQWLLAATLNATVVGPWMIVLFYMFAGSAGMSAMPGFWFPLLVFLASAGWEAGNGTAEPGDNPRPRRLVMLAVGVAVSVGIAYLTSGSKLKADAPLLDFVFFTALIAAVLWIQGMRNAAVGIDHSEVYVQLPWQVFASVIGMATVALTGANQLPGVTASLVLYAFLLAGAAMMLLVTTREQALRMNQVAMGELGGGSPVKLWMLLAIAVLIVGGIAASSVMSSPGFRAALAWLMSAADQVYEFALGIFLLIATRWWQVIYALLPNHKRPPWVKTEPRPAPAEDDAVIPPDEELLLHSARNGEIYFKIAIFSLAVILLTMWLYRIGGFRERAARSGEEERQSLGVLDSIIADLRGLFQRSARQVAAVVAPERLDPRDPRAIYRRLLGWGAAKGQVRGATETEGAYQSTLVSAGAPSAPVECITGLYQQARYAPQQPTPDQVEEALRAAKQLEKPS